MVPASVVRPTTLAGITTPAAVIPVEDYGEPFVVVGKGADATACFIGENHTFETMPAVDNQNWKGLAIEGLQVEVDMNSAYSLEAKHPMIGSIVRSGTKLLLVAKARDGHGFQEVRRFPVQDDLPEGADGVSIAFRRWRLVLRDGEQILYERVIEAKGYER